MSPEPAGGVLQPERDGDSARADHGQAVDRLGAHDEALVAGQLDLDGDTRQRLRGRAEGGAGGDHRHVPAVAADEAARTPVVEPDRYGEGGAGAQAQRRAKPRPGPDRRPLLGEAVPVDRDPPPVEDDHARDGAELARAGVAVHGREVERGLGVDEMRAGEPRLEVEEGRRVGKAEQRPAEADARPASRRGLQGEPAHDVRLLSARALAREEGEPARGREEEEPAAGVERDEAAERRGGELEAAQDGRRRVAS